MTESLSGDTAVSMGLVQWAFGLTITVGAGALIAAISTRNAVTELKKDIEEIQSWRKEQRQQSREDERRFTDWRGEINSDIKLLKAFQGRKSGPSPKAGA